jgi:hypothetical protein
MKICSGSCERLSEHVMVLLMYGVSILCKACFVKSMCYAATRHFCFMRSDRFENVFMVVVSRQFIVFLCSAFV